MNKENKKKQIRNLLLLIACSIFCAGLFTFFMVDHFGPSGRYIAKNALLSPERMMDMQFNDYNPKTGGSSRFIFDKIEFSFYDEKSASWQRLPITHEQYTQLYLLLSGDESLATDEDKAASFVNPHTASLILTIRTDSDAQWQAITKTFQEVQFIPHSDGYRIELREDVQESLGSRWAYFHHPDIYEKSLKILRGL